MGKGNIGVVNNRSKRGKKKLVSGLNSRNHIIIIETLALYQGTITKFKTEYQLNYPSIEVLNYLYINYFKTGMPVSIYRLHELIGVNSWYSVKQRLVLLETKGLVYGYTPAYSKFKMFEPSPTVINWYLKLGDNLLQYI